MRVKHLPRTINVTRNPTFIIGQCPGRSQQITRKPYVFMGNRTGKFINQIIKKHENLYLTNVFNYYYNINKVPLCVVKQGLRDLQRAIKKLRPRRIICLGQFASKHVHVLNTCYEVITLYHPSYVLRFNKNVKQYARKLKSLL